MDQRERRNYLIDSLIREQKRFYGMEAEQNETEGRRQLRSLMNIRTAAPITKEFEEVQDAYLQEINAERGIVRLSDLEEREPGIYLWQGDITRLAVDGIVNAANSGMTGCYQPCHNCIDNCIHTYATNKKLTGAKIITVSGRAKTSYTIKGLKKGKTYYVAVRPYKTVSGRKHFGLRNAYGKAVRVK